MAKMIFINYCPDDQLSGCMILSYKAELAYRRIQDLIYTNDNLLFDDPISWDLATRGFSEDQEQIKDELIKKRKISIEDGQIKNKRCSEEIQAAKDRHDKSKKAATARWGVPLKSFGTPKGDTTPNANASSEHTPEHMLEGCQPLTTNYKPLTTNNKPNIYTQDFDIFWQKYVLSENDRRSTKYDSYQQWKKLKAADRESLGDRFLTYRTQKGEYYKALERFISKKIYLEIVPEKKLSDQEMKDWKFNSDVDMRRKGMKPLSWSVGYIRELDDYIEKNPKPIPT